MNIYQDEFDKITEIVHKYGRLLELVQEYSLDLDNPELNQKFFELNFECKSLYKKLYEYNFFLDGLSKKYFEPFGGSLLLIDDTFFEPRFNLDNNSLASDGYSIEIKSAKLFLESLNKVRLEIDSKIKLKNEDIFATVDNKSRNKIDFELDKLMIKKQNQRAIISYKGNNVATLSIRKNMLKLIQIFKDENTGLLSTQDVFTKLYKVSKSKHKNVRDPVQMKGILDQTILRKEEYFPLSKYRISTVSSGKDLIKLSIKLKKEN